jgi:hypothetical protein
MIRIGVFYPTDHLRDRGNTVSRTTSGFHLSPDGWLPPLSDLTCCSSLRGTCWYVDEIPVCAAMTCNSDSQIGKIKLVAVKDSSGSVQRFQYADSRFQDIGVSNGYCSRAEQTIAGVARSSTVMPAIASTYLRASTSGIYSYAICAIVAYAKAHLNRIILASQH